MKRTVAVVWLAASGILACAAGSSEALETSTLGTPPPEAGEEPGAKLPAPGSSGTDPNADDGGASSSGASGSSSGASGTSASSSGTSGASGSSSGSSGTSGASGSSTSSSGSTGSSGTSGSSGASSSASSSGSSGAAGGDCPAGDLTYYYKAVTELAGPTPVDCPCSGSTCCYGGLVCVPL